MVQRISNKMNELILEYNLRQLITENTHFTEHSSSILDLFLVRNNNNDNNNDNNNIIMSGSLNPLYLIKLDTIAQSLSC